MGLRKCNECAHKISTKAKKCPNCGAPNKKQTSRLTWLLTIILGYLIITNFSSIIENNESQVTRKSAVTDDALTSAVSDKTFTVVSDKKNGTSRRSVEVVLNKKVSESELKQIAEKIKDGTSTKYDRTFVNYFLTEEDRGSGSWATTHFNPDLEVKILGLTNEQAVALSSPKPKTVQNNVTGSWLEDRPGVGSRIELIKDGSSMILNTTYSDGSVSRSMVVTKKIGSGLKIEDKAGNRFGEYFVLNTNGNLEFWSPDGKYYTAKKIE